MAIYPDKKDGRLTGRFRVEVQKDGQRARGRFTTLKEAQEAEAKWLVEMPDATREREDTRGVPKTLKDLWAKNDHMLWRGQADRDTARTRLERMITLVGAKTRLSDITTDLLDGVVATLYDDDLEPSTIRKYLSSLHKLLDWGQTRKWLTVPTFPWPSSDGEGRIRWLSYEEEQRLYDLLDERIKVLVRVAIATGLRRGELLGLTKNNIEYNRVHLWKTKTKKSRAVPIDSETHADLMWLLDVGMPTIHQLRYDWDKARKSMGLVGDVWFTFHVCRHTCATRLIQANVNIRVVQRWLGHASIKTTERYAHVADDSLSDALSHRKLFRAGQLASSPTMGYASPTHGFEGSSYNLRDLKINFRYGPNEGIVRGRGEIGRHAGFRFQWSDERSQDDSDDTPKDP